MRTPEFSPRVDEFDVFLCHNKADKLWVRELAEQIESETFEGTPQGRPLRVFFDEWDVDVGQNVVLRIDDGLRKARFVAVAVSPDLVSSDWPVLEWTSIVADDPANRRGRLIPLFLRDGTEKDGDRIELPAPLRVLNWIDFRDKRQFKQPFRRLVRRLRNLPPERGQRRSSLAALPPSAAAIPDSVLSSAVEPDRIQEVILANLLPVESFPGTVWSAPTAARQASDVLSVVPDAPAFELQEQRLYAFVDLSARPHVFSEVVVPRATRSESVSTWVGDSTRWRWFMSLLNRSLRNHLRRLPIRQDDKRRFFFLPKDGCTRKWRNFRDPEREVAAKKTNPLSGKEFWVHQAASLRFLDLGTKLHVEVEPCYVFTSDGVAPLGGRAVGPLSMKWTGRERNAAVLRHVLFWARTLARGEKKISIETGSAPVLVSGIPALARTRRGLEFDHIDFTTLLRQTEDELDVAAASIALSDIAPALGAQKADDEME